ncbi:MAG: menaquinone biosynthesis protein [Planctomycetota bacterium]|nr:menaquinone biosynthesis protein [Planctomycetota bacterium]
MNRFRLLCVQYLNTVPLIEGLSKLGAIELMSAVPAKIAPSVVGGEADMGLVSVADALASPELTLVPVGMIGCDGPTLTVRVFSRVPLERVRVLHADQDSKTSVLLARVIFAERYGTSVEIRPLDRSAISQASGAGWAPEAVLLIGDKVVTAAPRTEQYPVQLDLGQAWHELTGLAFVYAAWACRTSDVRSESVRSISSVLERQRLHNATRLPWIVQTRAVEHGWEAELAWHYLGTCLKYEFTERAEQGLREFARRASALLGREMVVRLADQLTPTA